SSSMRATPRPAALSTPSSHPTRHAGCWVSRCELHCTTTVRTWDPGGSWAGHEEDSYCDGPGVLGRPTFRTCGAGAPGTRRLPDARLPRRGHDVDHAASAHA